MPEKPYSETVRKLKNDKLQIRFSDSVCQDFAQLHEMLKDHDGFDWDTLRHLEDFSNPKFKRDIPVAFAAVVEVFKQVTAFAAETKNPALIEALDQLQSDLSGFGRERTPVTVVSVSPHR